MNDEAYVRSVWEKVSVTDWYAGRECAVQAWSIYLPCRWSTNRTGNTPHDKEMWSAAAEFTREHKEKVRQLRREIEVITEYTFSVEEMLGMAQINADRPGVGFDAARDHHAMSRILARLESALATLTAGMKPDVQP